MDALDTTALSYDDVADGLLAHLQAGAPPGVPDLDQDSALLESGLLTSMKIGQLLGFVRSEFGIDLPPELIEHDTFQSVRALATTVCREAAAAS